MSHQYTGKPGVHGSIPSPTASFSTHIDRVTQSRNSQQRKQTECVFCKGNHKANSCNVIVDPKERLAIVRRDNLCFNCLARHKASQCSSKFTCRMCKHRHHTSLCQAFTVDTQHTPTSSPLQTSSSQVASSQTNSFQTSHSQQTSSQAASSQPNVATSQQASTFLHHTRTGR